MRREFALVCLALVLITLTPVAAVAQNEIIGDWRGVMNANQTKGMKMRWLCT
jgi:hypothetical protein